VGNSSHYIGRPIGNTGWNGVTTPLHSLLYQRLQFLH